MWARSGVMERTPPSPSAGGTEMLVCFRLALAGGYFVLDLVFAHAAPSQQRLCWCFSQHMGLTWLHAGTADDGAVSSHPFPAISRGSHAAKPCLVFPPSQTLKPIQSARSSLLHPLSVPVSPGLAASLGRSSGSPFPLAAQCGFISLSKQIFQIFLAAPCFPLPSCNKGSKMFFPLGTNSGIS